MKPLLLQLLAGLVGALATPNAGFSVLVVAALLTLAPASVCKGLPVSTASGNCSHTLSFP